MHHRAAPAAGKRERRVKSWESCSVSGRVLAVGEQRLDAGKVAVVGVVHRKLRGKSAGRALVAKTHESLDAHDHRFGAEVAARELLRVLIQKPQCAGCVTTS